MPGRNKKYRTDIHQFGWPYRILRPIVDFGTLMSYKETEVSGIENIPEDGAVILAPNHSNALMDALVVLRTRRRPTVFGARADIFENPFFAKALHFLKIVPMVRKRDGIRNVIRNLDIAEDIFEVLDQGVPFCMFAEGTHRAKHSLLPIGKGIFRIAVNASQKMDKPVYVVPVGLEYGDYFRFVSTSLVRFGEAINVTEYLKEHEGECEAEIYRNLTSILSSRISSLISYVPDDEYYTQVRCYCLIANSGKRFRSLVERVDANKEAISRVSDKNDPKVLSVLDRSLKFIENVHSKGLSMRSFKHWHHGYFLLETALLAFFWLPLFIVSAVLSFPTVILNGCLVRKISDSAFHNSVRMASNLLLTPLMLIIWTIVLAVCPVPFLPWIFLLIPLVIFSTHGFYMGQDFFRIWASDLKLLFNRDIVKELKSIQDCF